jgi:hypothetical protein
MSCGHQLELTERVAMMIASECTLAGLRHQRFVCHGRVRSGNQLYEGRGDCGQACAAYHALANENCTPAPPPTVRVTQVPKAGPGSSSGCTYGREGLWLSKKMPAPVVFYQAREGCAGPDRAPTR